MATLENVFNPDSPDGNPSVVFLHGLGGDPRGTWTCENIADGFWPRWVGQDSQCPVWTLGYDATLSRWTGGALPLVDQGTTVCESLVTEPQLGSSPLVLVGHSLGGLVIKAAMVNAASMGVPRYRKLLDRIKGVVFIATPHTGAELANLAIALNALLRTNLQVRDLAAQNPYLRGLSSQFRSLHEQRRFRVRVFGEGHGVSVGPRIFGLFSAARIMVVDPSSSEAHVAGEVAIRLPEDHFSICKPRDRKAQIHKSLVAFLGELSPRRSSTKEESPRQVNNDADAGIFTATIRPTSRGPERPRDNAKSIVVAGLVIVLIVAGGLGYYFSSHLEVRSPGKVVDQFRVGEEQLKREPAPQVESARRVSPTQETASSLAPPPRDSAELQASVSVPANTHCKSAKKVVAEDADAVARCNLELLAADPQNKHALAELMAIEQRFNRLPVLGTTVAAPVVTKKFGAKLQGHSQTWPRDGGLRCMVGAYGENYHQSISFVIKEGSHNAKFSLVLRGREWGENEGCMTELHNVWLRTGDQSKIQLKSAATKLCRYDPNDKEESYNSYDAMIEWDVLRKILKNSNSIEIEIWSGPDSGTALSFDILGLYKEMRSGCDSSAFSYLFD